MDHLNAPLQNITGQINKLKRNADQRSPTPSPLKSNMTTLKRKKMEDLSASMDLLHVEYPQFKALPQHAVNQAAQGRQMDIDMDINEEHKRWNMDFYEEALQYVNSYGQDL